MLKTKFISFLFLFYIASYSQVAQQNGNWYAKEFSKDIALYNAKEFLLSSVLGSNETPTKFEIIPLAAASSGEITTLIYNSSERGKEGLVLGFYGNYWNDAGVLYTGYNFKNLDKKDAIDFLNKISKTIEDNSKYIKSDGDNNNVFFKFDDIDVLIYSTLGTYQIRLFWKGFDSDWEETAFNKSKRRFEKKLSK